MTTLAIFALLVCHPGASRDPGIKRSSRWSLAFAGVTGFLP
jgi:hypothetical protein